MKRKTMKRNQGYFVVRVNDPPACYKPGHFPRKFGTEKGAVAAAKEAVNAGASKARVDFPDMGELDFYPPKTPA